MDAVWQWSATQALERLAHGEISAETLVGTSLDRIALEDARLHAFITVCGERAMREAAASDRRRRAGVLLGPLDGLPFAVKDLADTAGVRTTYGSSVFADHVPDADELCVARLRAVGAILVGKTNTPEFGFGPRSGNALCPPTANPHDPRLSAGGSSGGSAAAVAAGFVPFAHGTDFGGSVRTPASFCGVIGLRPTPGLIPSVKKPLAWNALSTHGILARTADDAALMLSVMAGYDARDPLARPGFLPDEPPIDAERLSIARSPDLGLAAVASSVRDAFAKATGALAARFGRVVDAAPDCTGAIEAFSTLRAAIVHRQFAPMLGTHRARLTKPLIWNAERGAGLTADAWLEAEETRSRIYAGFMRFFDDHDLLLTPAAAVPPFPVTGGDILEIDGAVLPSPLDYLAVTFIISLIGLPSMSLPAGRFPSGTPFGIQVVAPPFREDRLHAFARAVERDLDFRHRWPEESPATVSGTLQTA